jgi:hypothetical protein
MHLAELRAALSGLEAALVLPPLATSMRNAVLSVASSCLGAALLMAPLASSVRAAVERATFSGCLGAADLLAAPAAPMRDAMLRAAVNSRLGAAVVLAPFAPAMRRAVPRIASARSTARLAGCLHVVPLLQTLMVDSTRPTPHRYTASTARRRDTLECSCCSEGGSALKGRVCESCPRCVETLRRLNPPPCQHMQVGGTAVHGEPPHASIPTDAPRGFSQ